MWADVAPTADLDGGVLLPHAHGVPPLVQPVVKPALAVLLAVSAGCAGVGESVAGVCVALAIQAAAEVCCEAAVGVVCDGDGSIDAPDDAPPPEVPPPERTVADDAPPPACRQRALAGGVWRLDCVDGTSAEALVALPPAPDGVVVDVIVSPPEEGAAVELVGLADVARLNGVLGHAGSVRVRGPALLSVSLPSLRTVGGDLDVEHAAQLRRLDLPALRQVGGTLRLLHNRLLQDDPCPAVTSAGAVDVAFNDALPPAVVDRLLTLGPPPPRPP